jgi:hypothetical protein
MPSLPLPRFLEQHQERRDHSRALEREVAQQGVDLAKRKKIVCDPADSLTLRGIPAVGRGVAGVIRGTQPESAVAS